MTDYISVSPSGGTGMAIISLLYERFSRREQGKRKAVELENDYRKRQVLKDLFRIYIKYDIINLSDEEFDQFINFCNLSDSFIKNSSRYDLVMTIKNKYEVYEKLKKIHHKF